MQTIFNYTSIGVTAVLIVLYVVTLVISIIKKVRTKSTGEQSNLLDKIYDSMLALIPEAEKIYNSMKQAGMGKEATSALKLSYVLDKVRIACYENNITFDSDYWKKEIETVIDVTKQVNTNEKSVDKNYKNVI